MLAPQKESIFGCSCRLWLLSWRRARIFARSCSLLSKYLPISWKQRKEQSHAPCHVTHRIRIFDKISELVKVAKSVDIAVPELAVTKAYEICHFVGLKKGKKVTTTKSADWKSSLLKLDQLMNTTSTVRLTHLSMYCKLVTDPVRFKIDNLSFVHPTGTFEPSLLVKLRVSLIHSTEKENSTLTKIS